jgi:hypothetical protein
MKTSLRAHLLSPIAAVATSLLLQSTSPAAAGHYSYDLKDDFSTNQNPNGVWSYDYNDSPISTFQTFWWGESGWGFSSLGDGAILKGNAPSGTDPWGNPITPPHDWKPGDVMMHALSEPYGGLTTFLNVKWTSPAAGTIDITGRAWDGEIFPDRNVGWSLIVDGTIVAQRSSVRGLNRKDKGARFSANLVGNNELKNIPVAQGSVVEFRVATESYYGHFVGVEEKITLQTSKH